MYKISIQYTDHFRRYHTETICVTHGTDVPTDSGDTICSPPSPHSPPPHPHHIENGVGIIKKKPLHLPAKRIPQGVQLILAYRWARPAVLAAGMGRGGMFNFFCVFTFIHFPLSPLSLSFISSTISSISLLPFSGRRHKMTHKG